MKLLLFLLTLPLAAATVAIDSGAAADQYFTGGAAFTTSTCPGDSTVRYGAFSYHIPVEPGAYLVTLNLCETGTVSAKGQRVFSVKLNGQTVLDRLDLFAVAGLAPKSFPFTAGSSGFIDIDFSYSVKSAMVSSIQIDVIGSVALPAGVGMSRKVAEPSAPGAACQDGDWAAPDVPSPIVGAVFYLCVGSQLRKFRGEPEPWGIPQVADLGGVLQMQTQDPTFPPVFYFRTMGGVMIGPFSFSGPGPLPSGLAVPVLIQPYPRAAIQ
jgi:hypothetical protein